MKQTKHYLRPLLMALVMMVGMLVPQGAWAQSPITVGDEEFSTIQDAIDYIFEYIIYEGGVKPL